MKETENINLMNMKLFIKEYIEESRRLMDSKAALILNELNNLREENENLLLRFRELLEQKSTPKANQSSLNQSQRQSKIIESPIAIKKNRNTSQNSKEAKISGIKNSNNFYTKKYIDHNLKKKTLEYTIKKKKKPLGAESSSLPKNKSGYNNYNNGKTKVKEQERLNKSLTISHEAKKHNASAKYRPNMSARENAFLELSKSKVLNFNEQLMCFGVIKSALSAKEEMSIKRHILQMQMTNVKAKHNEISEMLTFCPSKIARNCLNFIKVQDERELSEILKKNQGNKEENDHIKAIGAQFRIIMILLNIKLNNMNLLPGELVLYFYETVMPKLNINSLKNVFTEILYRKLNKNPNDIEEIKEIVKNNEHIFNSEYYLRFNRVPSFISYSLSEMYDFLTSFEKRTFDKLKLQKVIAMLTIALNSC